MGRSATIRNYTALWGAVTLAGRLVFIMALVLQTPFHALPLGEGLFAAIRAAAAAFTREELTPTQLGHATQVRQTLSALGGYMLEASDHEDLLARVDALIADPSFHRVLNETWGDGPQTLESLSSLAAPGEEYHSVFGAALGPAALPHLHEIHRCMLALVASLQNAFPLPSSEDTAQASSIESADPLWFLSDSRIPVPVARTLLAGLRCGAFTIAAWAATMHPIPGWLGLAISERWVDAVQDLLALFISVFGSSEFLGLVPPGKRIDAQALNERFMAVQQAYARFNAEAERSGEPVYPAAA